MSATQVRKTGKGNSPEATNFNQAFTSLLSLWVLVNDEIIFVQTVYFITPQVQMQKSRLITMQRTGYTQAKEGILLFFQTGTPSHQCLRTVLA
jgi:hypothetical protein